jgi:hypothetical protein
MNLQKIEFQRYRDFGQIINATFEFIRQNFMPLLKSIIFIVGPFILLAGIFGGLYQKSVFSFYQMTSLSNFGIVALIYFLMIIISMVTMISVVYSYVLIYLQRADDTIIQIDEVWSEVKSIILKVIGISISLFIFFILIFLVLFIPLALLFNISNNPFSIFLIMLIMMFPLVYLANKFTLVYFAGLYEKTGVIESLKRSSYLIKNRWWFTLGLVFVLSLIQGFLGFLLQVPQYIAMMTVMFNSMDGTGVDGVTEIIFIVTSVISAFNFIFYTIPLIAITFHYFSLVEQKEAKGLIEKIESI